MTLFGIYIHYCGLLRVDGVIVVLLRGVCLVGVDLHYWSLHTTKVHVSRSRSGRNLIFCMHFGYDISKASRCKRGRITDIFSPGRKLHLFDILQNGWLVKALEVLIQLAKC